MSTQLPLRLNIDGPAEGHAPNATFVYFVRLPTRLASYVMGSEETGTIPKTKTSRAASRRVVGTVPVFLALVLSACGAGERADVTRDVTREDLAVMVLPERDLGALATGFVLARDSGETTNAESAEGTPDPRDSGRTLARAGRLGGYRATYSKPGDRRAESDARVLVASTEAELFRDEEAAATYLKKAADDFRRYRGRAVAGVKLTRVGAFDVEDVGDEGVGITATLVYGRTPLFFTTVAFRRGRVVGSAVALLARDREMSEELERVARTLDDRIQKVAAGEIDETPVAAPPSRATAKKPRSRAKATKGRRVEWQRVATPSSARTPRVRLVAGDTAIARDAVLRETDLHASWSPVRVSNRGGPGCRENDADISDLTVTGKAHSALESGQSRMESGVKVFRNPAQAGAYFDATFNRTVLGCIRDGIKSALRKRGLEPELIYARFLTEPALGARTAIYVVAYAVTLSDGSKFEYPVELLTFQVGRAVAALDFSLIPSDEASRPCSCELDEARLVASRLDRA